MLINTINRVEFYNGTTLIHTEFKSSYSYNWENVPIGNYTLTSKSINDNSIVTTSNSVHVSVVANKEPSVSIITPSDFQVFEMPANIPLNADAKDDDGYITRVDFYLDGNLIATEYSYPYSIVWKYVNLGVGSYTLVAKATDNSGAVTTSQGITIQLVEPGETVPISKVSSANNQALSKVITNESLFSNEPLSLKLSPNPAHNMLHISISRQQNKKSELYILSASGVVIKNLHSLTSSEVPIDIASLVNGVYFIKVISGDKVMYKRFVKL
jgi:hypothetical protein